MRADDQRKRRLTRDGGAVDPKDGGVDVDTLIVGLIGHLTDADSLESLVGPIARLRRRCVLVLDRDLEIVASSATRHEAHPVERRTYERIRRMRAEELRELFGDAAGGPHGLVRTTAVPGGAFGDGVAHPIEGSDRDASWLWLVSYEDDIGAVDESVARAGAAIAAAFLEGERRLEAIEERYRAGFLERLLEGDLDVNPQVLERAKRHDFHPEERYRVVVARLEGVEHDDAQPVGQERDRLVAEVRRWLGSLRGPTLVTASLDQVVFLLPEGVEVGEGWNAWGGQHISAVVSRPHVGFRGVRRAYDEVAASLPHARPGVAMRYEELLLPRVMQGDPKAHTAFVRAHVAPLRADRHGDALEETLFALAEEGFHLARTAARLEIHISTLRHRVGRIEALTGLDLNDPQARFRVQVAHYLSHLI